MAPDPSRRLLSLLRPERGRCTIVAGLMLASVLAEVTIPYFTGHVTDWVASEDQLATIISMALLGVTSAITEFTCDATFVATLSRVFGHLHARAFAAVLHRDLLALRALGAGAVTARVTGDVDATHEAVADALLLLLWELARAMLLLVPMAWVAPALATTTLLAMPVLLLLAQAMGSVQQGLSQRVQEAQAGATAVAMETFEAMGTVRGFAFEAGAVRRYQRQLQRVQRLEATEALTYVVTGWISGFLALALKLGLLYYGGQMVAAGTISTGDLLTFLMYQLQFTSSIEVLLRYYPSLGKAVGSSEKVFEFLDEEEQRPAEGRLELEVRGHLKLEDVWFSYPEQQEPVLKGVSLELLPGQVLAVVGAPGAGKSTLVSLVLGLHQPHRGRVLLDGHPLPAYRHRHLRRQVAVVPQEPLLFSRSLHANISYGAGAWSRAQVTAAARCAGADPFIRRLPHGYDTDVGDLGTQLSGGQRQAVAIARALVRDPRVLVLDEPTSALDSKTSAQVEQAVLSPGRSVLVVTGQAALALRAQSVAVLAGGRLWELSSPTELLHPQNRCWGAPGHGDTAEREGGTGRGHGDSGNRDGDSGRWDGDSEDRDGDMGRWDGDSGNRDGDSGDRDGDSGDRDGDSGDRDGDSGDRDGDMGRWDGDSGNRDGDSGDRDGDMGRWDGDSGNRDGDSGDRDGDSGDRDGDMGRWDGDSGNRDGDSGDRDGDSGDRDGDMGRWDGDSGNRDGDSGRWDGDSEDRDGDMGRWDGDSGNRDGDSGDRDGDSGDRDGDMGRWDGDSGNRDGDSGDRDGDSGDRDGDMGRWDGDSGNRDGDSGRWDGDSEDRDGDMGRWDGDSGNRDGDSGDRDGDSGDRDGDMGRWDGDSGNRDGDSGDRDGDSGDRDGDMGRWDGDSGNRDGDSGNRDGDMGRWDGDSGNRDGDSGDRDGDSGDRDADMGRWDGDSGNMDGDSGNRDGDMGRWDGNTENMDGDMRR